MENVAVSVIIPMYNTEKYIAECLESLWAQTFKNFEIIVVDDCSTDNSADIVKNYIQKFASTGQALNLLELKKNSGYASIPRNEGLKVARGKYIFFMDSDDFILKYAFENFYGVAEKTQAEVVMFKNVRIFSGNSENFIKNMNLENTVEETEIEFIAHDFKLRMESWFENYFPISCWSKFVRRDFLSKNKLEFLNIMQEDSFWTFELICLAEKIVMTPQNYYFYRRHLNSVCANAYDNKLNPDTIYKKFDRIIFGLKHIDDFMGKIEFFQKNPDFRQRIILQIVDKNMTWIYNSYRSASMFQIYENMNKALKNKVGDLDIAISSLVAFSFQMIKLVKQNQIQN